MFSVFGTEGGQKQGGLSVQSGAMEFWVWALSDITAEVICRTVCVRSQLQRKWNQRLSENRSISGRGDDVCIIFLLLYQPETWYIILIEVLFYPLA